MFYVGDIVIIYGLLDFNETLTKGSTPYEDATVVLFLSVFCSYYHKNPSYRDEVSNKEDHFL